MHLYYLLNSLKKKSETRNTHQSSSLYIARSFDLRQTGRVNNIRLPISTTGDHSPMCIHYTQCAQCVHDVLN